LVSLHLGHDFSQVRLHEILQGYEIMETMGGGASRDKQEESRHNGTIGLLSPNIEEKIVDLDLGTPFPPNQQGELWFCGPFVMKGMFSLLDLFCS
jgi:long-subunit acyl-CoA synthetase (AMP-forming)